MASTIAAGTTSGTAIAIAGDTSGVLQLQTNGTTAAVTIDTSQNVGIGITTPQQTLHVNNASSPRIKLTNATTGTGSSDGSEISIFDADTSLRIINRESANILFGTADTERMRITSGGNVCIGKTAASGTTQGIFLQGDGIYGFTKNESGTGPLGYFVNANGTVDNGYRFASFRVTSGFAEVGTITTNGSSTTAYNTSSDYRLKENIAPMTGALATVSALKPVTYKWKIDGSAGQGFIAHELQAVVPDCVSGEKDAVETYADEDGNEQTKPKYQGVDTSFLVATLTAAIQELNAKVEAQAVRIAELEGAK
jgi:hypothetical protein